MSGVSENKRTSIVPNEKKKLPTLASVAFLCQKNSGDELLPPVRIEPGTSDPKSNTLLSELTWHVLTRGYLNFCLCKT